MDEWMHLIKKLVVWVLLLPLRLLPVKRNRVLLNNGLSHNYSDNPKAVAECLRKDYPECFEIIFAVDAPKKYPFLRGKGIKAVKFHSPEYFYYAMTAAVYLTNNGGYSYLPRRKKRLVIETWHGGGAYKKVGICEYKNEKIGRFELKLAAKNIDVFLSTSKCSTDMYSEYFLLPRSVFWEIGMPRNDDLVHGYVGEREEIRSRLGLSGDERLVLFAPTFRRLNGTEAPASVFYGIDPACVCAALQTKFAGTWRFAFRSHPGIRNRDGMPVKEGLDVSDYEDMQELLRAADVLITDFSSSIWDFMLTNRPIFLFAVDFDRYLQTTDVYTSISEWPFPKARDNAELEENILSFDEKQYAKDCARHYAEMGGCETGEAAQLISRRIYEHTFSIGAGIVQ